MQLYIYINIWYPCLFKVKLNFSESHEYLVAAQKRSVVVMCDLCNTVTLFFMSSRVLWVFQHRRKASAHFHRPRGRPVWLLCFTAWSRWREIVSVCDGNKGKEALLIKQSEYLHTQKDARWYVDDNWVILLKDAGWCSVGRATQQQERRCVQMCCGRGEELKV